MAFFANLRRVCAYLRDRMATHRNSVYVSSHFQTCVDERLKLKFDMLCNKTLCKRFGGPKTLSN